jgi:hypothetical protein
MEFKESGDLAALGVYHCRSSWMGGSGNSWVHVPKLIQ